MRRRDPILGCAETGFVRHRAPLRGDAVAGRDARKGMLGACIQRFSDHHTGLRPRMCILDAVDPRDNRAGTGERLEREMALIGRAPDIGSGSR